jgi:hypothetical protein
MAVPNCAAASAASLDLQPFVRNYEEGFSAERVDNIIFSDMTREFIPQLAQLHDGTNPGFGIQKRAITAFTARYLYFFCCRMFPDKIRAFVL